MILFSQNGDHTGEGFFTKTIEYNRIASAENNNYNQKSKSVVEKMLFGDFNAPFEFFYDPSSPGDENDVFRVQSGFRIFRDSLDKGYVLQIKKISNYKDARSEAAKFGPKGFKSLNISEEERKQIESYNSEMSFKYWNEVNKHLTVDTKSYSISDHFAETIYKKMSSFIQIFKASGSPIEIYEDGTIGILIMDGGYYSTFRVVVGAEVWSLKIHGPTGTALRMSDFCRQIIKEANKNTFNEELYTIILYTF